MVLRVVLRVLLCVLLCVLLSVLPCVLLCALLSALLFADDDDALLVLVALPPLLLLDLLNAKWSKKSPPGMDSASAEDDGVGLCGLPALADGDVGALGGDGLVGLRVGLRVGFRVGFLDGLLVGSGPSSDGPVPDGVVGSVPEEDVGRRVGLFVGSSPSSDGPVPDGVVGSVPEEDVGRLVGFLVGSPVVGRLVGRGVPVGEDVGQNSSRGGSSLSCAAGEVRKGGAMALVGIRRSKTERGHCISGHVAHEDHVVRPARNFVDFGVRFISPSPASFRINSCNSSHTHMRQSASLRIP